ncbi:antibiotic biosynthesis monooxygenase family protein [Sporosarcina limicola]|uniref:Heme-degrading monooxygenase HmoA n=1 Tax=Sporosarcina limicola TaxID=34101 RepID=A0A927MJF4_9BACL|nr:antibiotic biosynthesis monooxygenase [Sporosarcina limicola]MBE1554976.1 heme-degrading monooxygenase HmoA [Sporosarcina limicola]
MNIFLTSGTPEFMEKMKEKHAEKNMFVMYGAGNSLLLHETEKKTVFQVPRRYEVIGSSGTLQKNGYFVFNNIPVSDEGRPVFEHRFQSRTNAIDDEPGFIAFRLLRPLDSDTYIVLTEWSDSSYFTSWKNSSAFKRSHAEDTTAVGANSIAHIFSGAAYVTTYQMKKKEEEKT